MMTQQKKQLRDVIRERKTQYCDSTLKTLSQTILERLEKEEIFQASETILLYFSLNDEVHTHQFIAKWSNFKTILLPVVFDNELQLKRFTRADSLIAGAYGISEPLGELFNDYNSIDLAIIPGMAFDKQGNRLGRGKGYYDKFLPLIKAPKIGICFPFQLVEHVPCQEFDIPVDRVVY